MQSVAVLGRSRGDDAAVLRAAVRPEKKNRNLAEQIKQLSQQIKESGKTVHAVDPRHVNAPAIPADHREVEDAAGTVGELD